LGLESCLQQAELPAAFFFLLGFEGFLIDDGRLMIDD
jgi:hypothetical protein